MALGRYAACGVGVGGCRAHPKALSPRTRLTRSPHALLQTFTLPLPPQPPPRATRWARARWCCTSRPPCLRPSRSCRARRGWRCTSSWSSTCSARRRAMCWTCCESRCVLARCCAGVGCGWVVHGLMRGNLLSGGCVVCVPARKAAGPAWMHPAWACSTSCSLPAPGCPVPQVMHQLGSFVRAAICAVLASERHDSRVAKRQRIRALLKVGGMGVVCVCVSRLWGPDARPGAGMWTAPALGAHHQLAALESHCGPEPPGKQPNPTMRTPGRRRRGWRRGGGAARRRPLTRLGG